MSDPNSPPPKTLSSFFGSPKLFNGVFIKTPNEIQTVSPTSTLDGKSFSEPPPTFSGNKHAWENSHPAQPIGLALVDSLITTDEETNQNCPQIISPRKVLLGAKLNIQIPSLPQSSNSLSDSPKSPADFGIKTRNSRCFAPFGSASFRIQTNESSSSSSPHHVLSRSLSLSEMELSEDYTCVISHGPNPKTTHIYDNCVMENCCGGFGLSQSRDDRSSSSSSSSSDESNSQSESSSLSFC